MPLAKIIHNYCSRLCSLYPISLTRRMINTTKCIYRSIHDKRPPNRRPQEQLYQFLISSVVLIMYIDGCYPKSFPLFKPNYLFFHIFIKEKDFLSTTIYNMFCNFLYIFYSKHSNTFDPSLINSITRCIFNITGNIGSNLQFLSILHYLIAYHHILGNLKIVIQTLFSFLQTYSAFHQIHPHL